MCSRSVLLLVFLVPFSAACDEPSTTGAAPDAAPKANEDADAPPMSEPLSSDASAAVDATPPADAGASTDDAADPAAAAKRAAVLSIMEKVADWQIADFRNTHANSWIESTFYAGLLAAYDTGQEARFLQFANGWADANQWKLGARTTFADDQCAGQAYLELEMMSPSAAHLAPTQQEIDQMVAAPQPGRQVWWWEDALFMAPGVFVRLGSVTSQTRYYDAMNTMWWDTISYLLDPSSSLVFRDDTFFDKTCANGQKMFWARGNGWVVAAIPRVLDYLPVNYGDRGRYVDLLKTLTTKIATLQKPDGYWPSCLTDADQFPNPETSGTAGFVYGIAWGVNHGILSRATFLPIIKQGWNALVSAVDASGKLGWVQPTGSGPGAATQSNTQPFGPGLFLLAGSQVIKLASSL